MKSSPHRTHGHAHHVGDGGAVETLELVQREDLALLERELLHGLVDERDGLLERSKKLGAHIIERFTDMASRHEIIGDVRGRGMMTAIELVEDRKSKTPLDGARGTAIVKQCLANGVVILKAGTFDNVIRLLPPINIDEGLLDEGLGILDDALASA